MFTIDEIKSLLRNGEKVNLECKEAESQVPKSIFETYSAFANTNGGTILLGIHENLKEHNPEKCFAVTGVSDTHKIITDFWNTINGNKVNVNLLVDEDVYPFDFEGTPIVVIEVPRASYLLRPVYTGENPFKGSFKRNHEGDYHCSEAEVRAMYRDQNPDGNDSLIMEYYTMDDIDADTLKRYRRLFSTIQPEHIWNDLNDHEFLEQLGGYRRDRRKNIEGLTMAGLLMFGKGLPIRDEFDQIFMDYREEVHVTSDVRWNDRITYDGTWENNLFNFFQKVTPKLTADLKKPFKLEGIQRIDDTPQHKAVREALVNLIIHSDYQTEGTLKVIKKADGFTFTNPGILKLPKSEIYKGGNSKPRNPRMQTMLRFVGFGDNAGSGFPAILAAWATEGWPEPELSEDTILNQVTLTMFIKQEDEVESDPSTLNSTPSTSNSAPSTPNSAPSTPNSPPSASSSTPLTPNLKSFENDSLEDKILSLIRNDEHITRKEIARQTGASMYAVKKELARMKEAGIAEFIGFSRNGKWIIQS